jgi:hypothetical protein
MKSEGSGGDRPGRIKGDWTDRMVGLAAMAPAWAA